MRGAAAAGGEERHRGGVCPPDGGVSAGRGGAEPLSPGGEGDLNEQGLTALCSAGDFDVLITGDMAGSTERKLVGQYDLPDIEVLMVGHHGSRYSSSQELLQAVRPETAIISVGDNSYGHPTQEAMDRLEPGGSGDLPHRPAGKYFSDRTRRRLTMPPKAEKKNNGFRSPAGGSEGTDPTERIPVLRRGRRICGATIWRSCTGC